MEKISFYIRTSKKKNLKVNYRLREGRDIQMFHRSDIVADLADLNKFNPNGSVKGRVSIYNESLAKSLKEEYDIMCSAYTFMCDSGLDMTTEIFEREIARIKTPVVAIRETVPPLITRFRKYADDALKYGIVGEARYKHITIVADKLERFLIINGISSITAPEFTESHLMDFRDFIFNEHEYVDRYPKMYEKMNTRNKPSEKRSMNTVASQLKMLQTFMNELENTDEIGKSPFRKLGKERRKVVMKTRYDDPVFLRKEELQQIMKAKVPKTMLDTKNAFLLQCALGCRISDFQVMSMDTISVSPEGIPYVHYIPKKTADEQVGNEEVVTPIVRYAFDIIKETGFVFPILKNIYGESGYNVKLKSILSICKIDRPVPQFNEETKKNEYLPLYKLASSKLCRKTHVDMMNKVQVDMYAAGLHKQGSSAVTRYTLMEIKDRFALMNAAFGQEPYKVDKKLNIRK
jgi:hypothetical protein